MLALDDPRWSGLRHAYGSAGDIPALLRALRDGPGSFALRKTGERAWDQLWSALCHQGTIGTASYAALPHLVAIGTARPTDEQLDFWHLVGAIARAADAPAIPEFLRADTEAALATARAKVRGCLVLGVSELNARWLLVALASIDGRRALADALEGLIDGELTLECPECEEEWSITLTDLVNDAQRSVVEVSALATLARSAGHDGLAEQILALQNVVACPECGHLVPILSDEV